MSQKNGGGPKRAIRIIKSAGGHIRMAEALRAGINRRTFYLLRDRGILERISRGLYRLSNLPSLSEPDIAAVALRAPDAVICLLSALAFHGITTQIPHWIDIAVLKGKTIPRIDIPPVRVHRLREPCFSVGIQEHIIDGIKVRVYDPEKTLVDCFKFRNRLGSDVVFEALKLYRTRKALKIASIMNYARSCRVDKIIQPYIEASL